MTFKRLCIALLAVGAICVIESSMSAASPFGSNLGSGSSLRGEVVSTPFFRDDSDRTSEFIITPWTTEEGLPANEIHDVQETSDGYLWLGTHQGLVRFDGMRFQDFFTSPTGSRYGTRVGPLEVDARGRLWLVPDQLGVVYREGGAFTEVLTNGSVLKHRLMNLCNDGTNGIMWVDAIGGIGRILTDRQIRVETIAGGAAEASSRWMRDFRGGLWLENPRGLKLYSQGKLHDVSVPGSAMLVSAPRRAGGMWVAREARLRFVTADGQGHEVATFPWRGQTRVTCLMEDSRQRLWIGTANQGLFCYSGGQFKHVMPMASSILCLLEGEQENIWVGTRGSGLIRLRPRQFFVHDLKGGLENEFVRSLAQDREGRVWLLTAEGGLGWWQNGLWHRVGEAEGWRNYEALCVLPVSDGSVWVSTVRRGLWHWSNGRIGRRELESPLQEPPVDLLEDRKGRIWMVTDNAGVYCYDGHKLTHYSTRHGLPNDHIRQIVEDEAGDIWAGDWQGGISRLVGEGWEVVRKPTSHTDAVRCMAAGDGAIWIGTSAGGLLRLKNGKFNRASVDEGMPNACVQQLLLDRKGSLWGGTPHRLFRISLQRLNAVMDGSQRHVDAMTYGRSDGLPDASFANWCDPRSWRTTEGELWFATANGAIHFQPGELRESKPPRALLDQVLLDGKPAPVSSLRNLRPDTTRLEFRFTAPCLTAPERVHFRYQLSGFDGDWVDAGTARSVTYATVPAGEHLFRVVACSPDGVWSSQPDTVALVVTPYYWQTNWFLATIAAAIAGGAVWMIRRATVLRLRRRVENLRQQQAIDRERARIAQDIHDELGANLTSIALLADMGVRHKTDPTAVTRELDQISQAARESVSAMDSIVWALNPKNDSLDHFANYISQFTNEFFRPTQLRIRLELPTDLPAHPMSTETRHELFLIVKESFNNIVRHSQATEVNLELACRNGHLHLTIADNGKGLDGHAAEGQDGLGNLRDRITRLGGTLCIESKPGHGAKLNFALPINEFGSN